MRGIYYRLWQLAKPYYRKGREMDLKHVAWMKQEAEVVCENEAVDDTLFLPLVILHDVGYAEVEKASDPYRVETRKKHMEIGARIAGRILEEVDYPKNKTDQIVYFVSVHDNWALGDDEIYRKHKILHLLTDLDFIWLATPQGFEAVRRILGRDRRQMLKFIEDNETLEKRPMSTKTTRRLFETYFAQRQKEVAGDV